jgi:BASS family bile acid:Na+ symporter
MTPADANALSSVAARALIDAYLVTSMLSMGLAVGAAPKEQKSEKRRQRRLLLGALALNLVLLPLATVAATHAFRPTREVTIALVLLAAAPGGRFAPHLTGVARGELSLSVEITLFLAKLTGFTAPLVARWLLHVHHLELHELTLIAHLLVLQIVPYFGARLLRQHRPRLALQLARPLERLSFLAIAAIAAFLVAHHELRSVLVIGGAGWLAIGCIAVVSLALGWALGGHSAGARVAIATSVNSRNLALAWVMASFAFPEVRILTTLLAVWLVLGAASLAFALAARRQRGGPWLRTDPIGNRARGSRAGTVTSKTSSTSA